MKAKKRMRIGGGGRGLKRMNMTKRDERCCKRIKQDEKLQSLMNLNEIGWTGQKRTKEEEWKLKKMQEDQRGCENKLLMKKYRGKGRKIIKARKFK